MGTMRERMMSLLRMGGYRASAARPLSSARRALAREFLAGLKPRPAAHWLEVGCGTGALTAAVCAQCDPASVLACDPSAAFVAHARRHIADERATFVTTGAEDLPTLDGGF